MASYSPESVHQRLLTTVRPALSFGPDSDFDAWRSALATKLREVVGVTPADAPLDVRVEWQKSWPEFDETRFVVTTEPGAEVPCHLLLPRERTGPLPVVICLQGHTSGMHVSLARTESGSLQPAETVKDRDFAIQAVRRGWAALAMEQRCFGERADARPEGVRRTAKNGCHHASHVASLLGRTMIGERTWDVSRVIDALDQFPAIDNSRIACMGNSGGGTITWYAACLDSRIQAVMPSCSVCSYRTSIAAINHCCDNYLPGALPHFDMHDLAGLIAPRPLVVVAGRRDDLFPFESVEASFATIQAIYTTAGAADRCALVAGESGHQFYADQSWPVLEGLTGWALTPETAA